MDINKGAKIDYNIVKADARQIELLYETHLKNSQTTKEQREGYIIFLAVDKSEDILGRLIASEKTVPPPLGGISRFIMSINVRLEFRRRGIASALLEAAEEDAKQANAIYLYGSADPTLRAHMLYNKYHFCFCKYGKICGDEKNQLEYGNYRHMFFRRLDKTEKPDAREGDYRVIKAGSEHIETIYNEYLLKKNPQSAEFFADKKDDIFGFIAEDDQGAILGTVAAYADGMGAPLDGIQWWLPYIFVRPEFRRRSIGSALVAKTASAAKEAGVTQLSCIFPDEESVRFWYANNFDIYFWGKNPETGKHSVSAGMRLN